jgi:hypothetical protein
VGLLKEVDVKSSKMRVGRTTRDLDISPLGRLLVVLLGLPSIFWGQDPDGARWQAAIQSANGKTIQIRLADGSRSEGRLLRGTESELILRGRRGETTIARTEVRQLRMLTGRTRGRRVLLGSMIGLGIGAGVATAATVTIRLYGDPGGGNDDKYVAAGIGIAAAGAGIGAAIGAALPSHYQTIYEVQ